MKVKTTLNVRTILDVAIEQGACDLHEAARAYTGLSTWVHLSHEQRQAALLHYRHSVACVLSSLGRYLDSEHPHKPLPWPEPEAPPPEAAGTSIFNRDIALIANHKINEMGDVISRQIHGIPPEGDDYSLNTLSNAQLEKVRAFLLSFKR